MLVFEREKVDTIRASTDDVSIDVNLRIQATAALNVKKISTKERRSFGGWVRSLFSSPPRRCDRRANSQNLRRN